MAFQYLVHFNPKDLLKYEIRELHKAFGCATVLLHIPGKIKPPLFISTLLHGNEWTGFHALQEFIRKNDQNFFPRETYILLGNLPAAEKKVRFLEGQQDYNRIWPEKAEYEWTEKVLDIVKQDALFATIDIHNNTGRSPHYAIVSKHDNQHYNLANLFSKNVIYLESPPTAMSIHMSDHCPSLALECGLSDHRGVLGYLVEFLESVYRMHEISYREPAQHDMCLFETLASMHVPQDASFTVQGDKTPADISILEGIVKHNFVECPVGTPLAKSPSGKLFDLQSTYLQSRSTEKLLKIDDGHIVTQDMLVPCMLTEQRDAILKDCFGYLMKRVR